MRKILLFGALLAASVAACADDQPDTVDDDSSSKNTSTSSSTSTGGGQGGNGQGGDQGGNPQGGNPQGGNPQGGNPQGGNPQGGNPQGGNPQGGNSQGGNSQGGSSNGGSSQGGASTGGNGQGGGSLSCIDAETCSTNGSQICDQPSQTCMPPQCTVANPNCANVNDVCLLQFPNSNNGACYPTCAPFTANCGVGQECLDLTGEGVEGACFYTGSATLGQTCTAHDINTGCSVGNFCGDPGTGDECLQQCNYWGNNASCTAVSQSCYFVGICLDTSTVVDPAAVNQPCTVGMAGDDCAKVGDKVNGTCQNDGFQLVCMKNCRVNFPNDCPLTQSCLPYGQPFDLFGVCF